MSTPIDEFDLEDGADVQDEPERFEVAEGQDARKRALLWMRVWFIHPGIATAYWGEGGPVDLVDSEMVGVVLGMALAGRV